MSKTTRQRKYFRPKMSLYMKKIVLIRQRRRDASTSSLPTMTSFLQNMKSISQNSASPSDASTSYSRTQLSFSKDAEWLLACFGMVRATPGYIHLRHTVTDTLLNRNIERLSPTALFKWLKDLLEGIQLSSSRLLLKYSLYLLSS